MSQEKIFVTDKGLISTTYKQIIELNIKNTTHQKLSRRPTQTFLQGNLHSQDVHEKMLNIANHQRNANQNYNEVSPHTSQNGHR